MSGQLLICLLGGDPEVKKPFAIAMLVSLLSISDGLSPSVRHLRFSGKPRLCLMP